MLSQQEANPVRDLLEGPREADESAHAAYASPFQTYGGPTAPLPTSKVEGKIHAEGLESEEAKLEFMGAPMPLDEEERFQVLCGLEGSMNEDQFKPDERFDDITKLVSCRTVFTDLF